MKPEIVMISMATNILGSAEVVHLDHVAHHFSKHLPTILLTPNTGSKDMFLHKDSYNLKFYGNRTLVLLPFIKFILKDIVLALHLLFRKPTLVYARFPVSIFTLFVILVRRLRLFVEMNGIQYAERGKHSRGGAFGTWVFKFLTLLNIGYAERVICVSEGIKKTLQKDFNTIPTSEKLVVVENGVDMELFSIKDKTESYSKTGLSDEYSYVLFVGNLAPWFEFDFMLNTMTEMKHQGLQKWKLLIAGDGVMREYIENKIIELELTDMVELLGPVPHTLVPYYVSISSICLVPYIKGRKCSSMKAREYLAAGGLVLAADLPDLKWIEDKNMGVLYEAGNYDSFRDKLNLIINGRGNIDSLSEESKRYEFIKQNHSWDQTIRYILNLFERNQYQ